VAVVDIYLGYEADLKKVETLIEDVLKTMPEQYEEIVSPPSILGIQQFGVSEVVLRVTAETLPLKNAYIAREIRKAIKLKLDAHKVDAPYQRIVMFSDKEPQKQNNIREREGG
jgi:small conductance mechanosensitive channel